MVSAKRLALATAACAALATFLVGCTNSEPTPPAPPASQTDDHDDHDHMPRKVKVSEEDRKLYLTPGGMYTEADIKANGNMVAAEKFKGIRATHDVKPAPGDPLCPISMTKANTKFTWVIGGKTYEFCCPPCVDEFVRQAKERPDELKPADEYRKQ